MNDKINLQESFTVIKNRLWIVIGITFLAVLFAAIVSYFVLTPTYQSSTQILVTQQQSETELDSSAIQTNLQLINTYSVIIKSPFILTDVIESLDLDSTPSELYSQINISSEQNSQVVNLTVQDVEHHKAVDIANTTAEVFQEKVVDLMQVDNVKILSPAIYSENPVPVKPNKVFNIAIATVIGLMIGVSTVFLLEYLDTTVKTEQDVEELLELPVLGLISTIPETAHAVEDSAKKGSDVHVEKVYS